MIYVSRELKDLIDAAKPRLTSITESEASDKPYADKWSIKEILGHLLDSASNNHQRIIRMQELPDIGSFRYSQDHWVSSQHYQSEPWQATVEFWYLYNSHLAHIIAHVDPASLGNKCDMGYTKPATLKFVIEDYVRHVRHHLDQIFSNVDPRQRKRYAEGRVDP